MTEAGEKWLRELTGEASSFDIAEADFWLRAFCEEIEKIATACNHHEVVTDTQPCWMCRGKMLTKLKRELLGDDR